MSVGAIGGGGLAAAAGGAKGAGAAGEAGLIADNMMAQALKGQKGKGDLPPLGKMPKTLPMPKGLPKTLPSAPKGADFGRNGALARGQGFSQRDTFQAAQKKTQPGAQGPTRPQEGAGAKPQDQVKKNQPRDAAPQRKGEDEQARKGRQIAGDAAMDQMRRKRMNIELLLQASKQFAQWSKEMMDIFKPSR